MLGCDGCNEENEAERGDPEWLDGGSVGLVRGGLSEAAAFEQKPEEAVV